VGGDITSWDEERGLVVSVAILSRRAKNEPIKRSGAKAGDVICVTGTLGGSWAGKHLNFEPRVNEAIKLAQLVKINAMMDISDGLSTDLHRICKQSKVGAVIEADKIPISEAAKESADPLESALNDGEDFELLFTLAEGEYEKLKEQLDDDLAVSAIGKITQGGQVRLKMDDGSVRELKQGGYDHLKG
jgi:thiamine-monophosphate kinase